MSDPVASGNGHDEDYEPTLIQARYIDEWAIVRLPDGRLGSLSKRARKPVVCTVDAGREGWDVGVEVSSTDELEVVAFPAQMAQEWLKSQGVTNG